MEAFGFGDGFHESIGTGGLDANRAEGTSPKIERPEILAQQIRRNLGGALERIRLVRLWRDDRFDE